MSENIISKSEIKEFESICSNIIKVASHLIEIHTTKRQVLKRIVEDIKIEESEHNIRHPAESELEILRTCLNRELALERAVGNHINKAKQYFNHNYDSIIHHLKSEKRKYLNFKKRVSASKTIKLAVETGNLFNFLLEHLSDWITRLRKEEEYLKYQSTASLLEMKKLWRKDLDVFWDLKTEISEIRHELKQFGIITKGMLLGSGFLGMALSAAGLSGNAKEPLALEVALVLVSAITLSVLVNVIMEEKSGIKKEIKIINRNEKTIIKHKKSQSSRFFSGSEEKKHFD